jgi:FtsP/CotA-like multicopper oxidase with cupredoxin domain
MFQTNKIKKLLTLASILILSHLWLPTLGATLCLANHNRSYIPVITPNVSTLDWTSENGVKVYHLVAEPLKREFSPGMSVNCWGYNGQSPGPTIEAVEGDRVRILVTNHLPEPTTVHWHGLILPNGMDGVTGLTQRPIQPGETFKYEFTLRQTGTYMYHPHYDDMTQIAMGMMGFFIIHPRSPSDEERVDRDFAIMLHEWAIPVGASTPDPMVMVDFNYFTFNSKVWPGVDSLVIKKDQKVRIRLGNLSMNSHPIHLHGYEFTVVARGARRMKPSAQYESVTVNVPVGSTREIEFMAHEPGDWALHCHKSHHVMNGMEHEIPNLIGVHQKNSIATLQKLFPNYMPMGSSGMGEMFQMSAHHQLKGLTNYLQPGSPGPYGVIELSGMFTLVKVREGLINYDDPGWYQPPAGTVAERVTLD